MKRPDRATRALEAFGVSEPLIGDLQEERLRRDGRLWYPRQTLAAITVSLGTDVRSSKWRALGSVLGGWAVLAAWAGAWSFPGWRADATDPTWLAYTRYPLTLGIHPDGTTVAPHPLLLLTMCLVAMAGVGVAGRLSRPARGGLVLFLLTLPLYGALAGYGWIAGHEARVVLTFGITHLLAMASALVAGLWSIPMREHRRSGMPRSLVCGGWALGGLGFGVLALVAALLTARYPVDVLSESQISRMQRNRERPGRFSISPDGGRIVYVSNGRLWIRSLDGEEGVADSGRIWDLGPGDYGELFPADAVVRGLIERLQENGNPGRER